MDEININRYVKRKNKPAHRQHTNLHESVFSQIYTQWLTMKQRLDCNEAVN